MKRFIESDSRAQATLFPERLDDWIAEDNPMRAVDAFVDELDLATIADFRRDNGPGLRQACRQFVQLCRQIGLFEQALVAIDGSKFKAVNNRDKNFTPHKLKARRQQLDQSIARYLPDLDRADRDPSIVQWRGDPQVLTGADQGARAEAAHQELGYHRALRQA
jgi:hypothetical protein